MEKSSILLFLALLNLQVLTQGQPESWIGIDCGSNRSTSTNGILWQTDEAFIQTGTNHLIPDSNIQPLAILNTLRLFTEQNKNCYNFPAITMTRYFIRAVFFYANYDGLSNPPSFDLQIDGNKWVTVVTSSTEVQYYEVLYPSQNSYVSVCLTRTQNNHFPFISSLEAWPILYTMYTGMNQELAWLNSYRYDYGSNNGIIGYPGDYYNRIWEPKSVTGAVNTSADPGTTIISSSTENPPESSILDAIEAQNATTSLFLSFGPIKTITPIYFEAYFTEMKLLSTGTRSFDMYVDGKSVSGIGTITPTYYTCTAEPVLVQATTSNLTIELQPTADSLLPPIISAIEIYTASDPLVTRGTDQNDLKGLETFTSSFDWLKGWSGEPCLPADTVWQWLGCSGGDPPRVTSINLSGYDLNGSLPNFSQMQALEDIDLSKNSLSGEIPGFLGQLPNLKKLNLSYNKFSGALPVSIRNNRGLVYDINGNPDVDASGKDGSSKATIIGLAVGIPLLVILTILALVYWLTRRRANQSQNEATAPEIGSGGTNGHESFTVGASSEQHIPSAPMEPTADEDDYIPVSTMDMKLDNQSMIPDMDLEELEELMDWHANDASRHEVASDEECMVPELDLEELDEIIRQEKEKADQLLAEHKSVSS